MIDEKFQAVPSPDQPPVSPKAPSGPGCLPAALLTGMAVWAILATLVYQTATWVWEQQFFEGAIGLVDPRWWFTLLYAAAILLPAAGIWAVGSRLSARPIFTLLFAPLALAGGYVLFLIPAHLVKSNQELETSLWLIAGSALFCILISLLFRKNGGRVAWHSWGSAVLIGLLVGFPWVIWGALGSVWDIGLNLMTALLFGAAAALIAAQAFRHSVAFAPSRTGWLLQGLVMALALLVMVSGLGMNGNQGLLALAIPALGWALAILWPQQQPQADALSASADGTPLYRLDLALLVGLAIFWPLAFIDPDELAAVISLSAGELSQWANLAAMATLGLVLALGVVLLILRRPTALRQPPRWVPFAAAGVGAALLLVYGLVGQPGLYGERLFVILKDQADVSGAAQIQDYAQRRETVYQTLVEKADSSQAALRADLDRVGIRYQPYYLVNAVEVQAGPLVRWWLLSRPEVDRVLDNPELRPLPEALPVSRGGEAAPADVPWNLKMIGADRVWNELGVTGKGILIGQSDSGVQGDHPELAAQYRGKNGQNDTNWYDPWFHSKSPVDIGGHGTHTLGTILGSHVGVAPGAEWIGCVNLARNLGNPSYYLDCMQFMLAPFPQAGDPLHDGRPELGAMILNNSWGCPPIEGCDANALLPAVTALRAAGIFVVASAGNSGDGGCGSVTDPIALYDAVYSVGAIHSGGELSSFSSLGPVEVDGSGRTKPDIVAPGEGVLSAFPGGTYNSLSGTSMAGPHVAGVVALMWSANPDLIGDIDRTKQLLDETATPYRGSLPSCVASGTPNNGVGYGILNAYAAVEAAHNLKK